MSVSLLLLLLMLGRATGLLGVPANMRSQDGGAPFRHGPGRPPAARFQSCLCSVRAAWPWRACPGPSGRFICRGTFGGRVATPPSVPLRPAATQNTPTGGNTFPSLGVGLGQSVPCPLPLRRCPGCPSSVPPQRSTRGFPPPLLWALSRGLMLPWWSSGRRPCNINLKRLARRPRECAAVELASWQDSS